MGMHPNTHVMDIETNTVDFCNNITFVYVDDYRNERYYY